MNPMIPCHAVALAKTVKQIDSDRVRSTRSLRNSGRFAAAPPPSEGGAL